MSLTVHVWEFLNRDFKTIAPSATLGEAMEVLSHPMKSGGRRQSLVVVDEKDRPLGVIAVRHILEAFKSEFGVWAGLLKHDGLGDALEKGLKQCDYRLVEDYMVHVPTLKMGDDLLTAYKTLTDRSLAVRAIPVVEAEKVEGIVRIPDLFKSFFDAYKKTC